MAQDPHMLWFSVTTEAGTTLEYELPDQEVWFTRLHWKRYHELNDLAKSHGVAIGVSDRSSAK